MSPNRRVSFQLCSGSLSANTGGERRVKIRFWSDSKPVSVILGQHRALGPSISKVRSLKLDSSIWSNELVEVGSLSKDLD